MSDRKKTFLAKLLLGVVIGSAVAAVANPKSREFIKEHGKEALEAGKQFISERTESNKPKTIWHRLHHFFH